MMEALVSAQGFESHSRTTIFGNTTGQRFDKIRAATVAALILYQLNGARVINQAEPLSSAKVFRTEVSVI